MLVCCLLKAIFLSLTEQFSNNRLTVQRLNVSVMQENVYAPCQFPNNGFISYKIHWEIGFKMIGSGFLFFFPRSPIWWQSKHVLHKTIQTIHTHKIGLNAGI